MPQAVASSWLYISLAMVRTLSCRFLLTKASKKVIWLSSYNLLLERGLIRLGSVKKISSCEITELLSIFYYIFSFVTLKSMTRKVEWFQFQLEFTVIEWHFNFRSKVSVTMFAWFHQRWKKENKKKKSIGQFIVSYYWSKSSCLEVQKPSNKYSYKKWVWCY